MVTQSDKTHVHMVVISATTLVDSFVTNADPIFSPVLHNQYQCSLKDYDIVTKIFVDNYSEVEYFYGNTKDSVAVLSAACN
jgi:hypothetical protein